MMSRDITEVIDDYCFNKYGHTNWAWTDTLDDEEDQRRMSELGELEGNIIFYFEDGEWWRLAKPTFDASDHLLIDLFK